MRYLSAFVTIVLLSGCGGGSSSPTAPSTPSIPQVAGTYNGTVTMVLPELGQSLTCPTNTAVTQSGSSINIAPLVLGGGCGGISIPFGSASIDATGNLIGAGSTTLTQSCGVYTATGSGGFFGRELRLSVNATSRTCYNFNMTAVLSR